MKIAFKCHKFFKVFSTYWYFKFFFLLQWNVSFIRISYSIRSGYFPWQTNKRERKKTVEFYIGTLWFSFYFGYRWFCLLILFKENYYVGQYIRTCDKIYCRIFSNKLFVEMYGKFSYAAGYSLCNVHSRKLWNKSSVHKNISIKC